LNSNFRPQLKTAVFPWPCHSPYNANTGISVISCSSFPFFVRPFLSIHSKCYTWSHTHNRTPWTPSTRHRDRYLHNKHRKQSSIPQAGFEPGIAASEWPQNHILHRTVIMYL